MGGGSGGREVWEQGASEENKMLGAAFPIFGFSPPSQGAWLRFLMAGPRLAEIDLGGLRWGP